MELTINDLRELLCESERPLVMQHSWQVGHTYIVMTCTHYYTGRLVAVTATDIELADAAWVADTGRFADAMKTGELKEVEPYPSNVFVCRAAIVSFAHWPHALPREQV